jgi:uncharacterized membrane protein
LREVTNDEEGVHVANETGAAKLDRIRAEYSTRVVKHLNEEFYKRLGPGDRVADKVAKFGGSWRFIGIFGSVIVLWMAANVLLARMAWDIYPFILLNLVLSCLAALQAPVIMMAQNRAEERSHVEAELDYAINMKAEEEISDIQQDLDDIRVENVALKAMLEEVLKRLPPA